MKQCYRCHKDLESKDVYELRLCMGQLRFTLCKYCYCFALGKKEKENDNARII